MDLYRLTHNTTTIRVDDTQRTIQIDELIYPVDSNLIAIILAKLKLTGSTK